MDVFTTSPRVIACRSPQIQFKLTARKCSFRRLQGSHPCALSASAASLPLLQEHTLPIALRLAVYSSNLDKSRTAPLSALLASKA